MSSKVSLSLSEPVLFLVGGQEHERARARRNQRQAHRTPANSRPGSRPGSRPPSPPLGLSTVGPDGTYSATFVPSPSRGGAGRAMSPSPAIQGGSRSNSRSRVLEGLTTGSGTAEEAAAADEPPPAMLRGLLTLTLSKPSRIRSISVKLKGIARTDWPEGIGPRRLDVLEESELITQSWTFFSASNSSNERRAASVGPSVRDNLEMDGRGRSGARRAASMIPSREMNNYSSRDDRIQEDDMEPNLIIEEQEEFYTARPPLSRIPSTSILNGIVPPVEPGESSPAYERISSPGPSSYSEPLMRMPSIDLLNPPHSHFERSERRSATPTRSPLGPNHPRDSSSRPTSASSDQTRFEMDSTTRPVLPHLNSSGSVVTLSTESGLTTRTQSSTGEEGLNGWNSAPVPGTSRSSFERGRSTTRDLQEGNLENDIVVPTSESPESQRIGIQSSPETRPPAVRNTSGGSIGPPSAARRNFSNGPPPVRSASSRPSRFSLGALGDALRGKSTSRVRDHSSIREDSRGRGGRDVSPDNTRPGDRDQSRGRKTALKVLRDALTSGPDLSVEDSDEEEDSDEKNRLKGWKEFKAGTYTYPISIPIPASLPPTISADFGTVAYTLKAIINRAGALTPNLTFTTDVTLVSAPSEDDTEESESIVVERFWESQMRYHIALSGKSFPVGARIPIAIRLNPLAKIKLYRITAVLEQRVNYFASGRKLTRHENPKKFPLLRIENSNPKEPLLPILSESSEAIRDHPLAAFFINPTSSDDTTPSCLDPIGPWNLESFLQLPDCSSRLTFSTAHDKANISVSHLLKIMLRVERGDDEFLDSKGKRKLWDVIIETPVHILSCRCSQNTLPAYSTSITPVNGTALSSNCTFDHSIPINRSSTGHMNPRTSQSPAPIPPTVEQTLLFARLVAGEITASGEVPPSYNAITRDRSTSTSTNNTTRGRQNNRPGESPSQIDSSSTNSDTRGESSSMNRGARSASALRS